MEATGDGRLVFRNSALRAAISEEDPDVVPTELVFLLALEGNENSDPRIGMVERTVNTLVKTFQPNPVFMHTELFIPTEQKGGEVHFSTYLGKHAAWGSEYGNDAAFYMGHNESHWRALPVMGKDALKMTRRSCTEEADVPTPYSLSGYVFSVRPLRAFAQWRDNTVGSPAHCASLCARVLSRAIPAIQLPCSDAWYGPSTLFIELSKQKRMADYHEHITETTPSVISIPEQNEWQQARETLLSGDNEAVRMLSTNACKEAVTHQAHLVIKERATTTDEARIRVLEKGIARMLIRWSVLQNTRG